MEYTFPQYRMLMNGKSYYRILSPEAFDEIQLIGKKAFLLHVAATQYPEFVRIQEMLSCADGLYMVSDEEVWQSVAPEA